MKIWTLYIWLQWVLLIPTFPFISLQTAYVVHIFPPCPFSEIHVSRLAPDLLQPTRDVAYLMIIIATVWTSHFKSLCGILRSSWIMEHLYMELLNITTKILTKIWLSFTSYICNKNKAVATRNFHVSVEDYQICMCCLVIGCSWSNCGSSTRNVYLFLSRTWHFKHELLRYMHIKWCILAEYELDINEHCIGLIY